MTRVEGTSYVSVARDSMQTQFSRFSFKTKKHNRPKSSNLRVQDRALYEEFQAECADLKKIKRQVELIKLQTTSCIEC